MMNQMLAFMQRARDAVLGAAPQPDDAAPGSQPARQPTAYFILCIALYAVYMALMQSDWVFSGEMWAEMATNYFPVAADGSWSQKLFTTDAGYIPLPQRLLAAMGWHMRIPVKTIPYFYTWSALGLSGAIVGSFCLRPFRALIPNDLLRFLVSLSVLLIVDFETRTFVNFTYFCGFFVATLTALALVPRSKEVPAWAWSLPLTMLSKPALLATLPALLLAAPLSGRRFRRIVAVCVIAALVQLVRLYLSARAGQVPTFLPSAEYTIVHKLGATLSYSVGLLGLFWRAQPGSAQIWRPVLLGLALLLLSAAVMVRRRTPASALLLVGFSLVLFNMLINCFALTVFWNIDLQRLAEFPIFRHTVVALSGIFLLFAALTSSVFGRSVAGPAVFASWFVLSGWLAFAGNLNRSPSFPLLGSSHWQALASTIETREVACVPIDPMGLIFGRQCFRLNPELYWNRPLVFRATSDPQSPAAASVVPPPGALGKKVHALAIVVKPQAARVTQVRATAVLTLRNGQKRVVHGERALHASGGLVLFTCDAELDAAEIASVTFHFEPDLQIGFAGDGPQLEPAVLWMGN